MARPAPRETRSICMTKPARFWESQGWGLAFVFDYAGFVARMERSEIRGGRFAGASLPDCASLHPGYEEK